MKVTIVTIHLYWRNIVIVLFGLNKCEMCVNVHVDTHTRSQMVLLLGHSIWWSEICINTHSSLSG